MRRIAFLSVLLACLSAGVPAFAAPGAEPVKVALQVFKVVDNNGQESLVESKTAKPGETLEYRAVYSNVSKKNISRLVASLPVPAGMVYVAKSVRPLDAEATTDGKSFAPVPLIRKKADGRTAEPVPVEEYRALRWNVASLPAGKSFEVAARMRVASK